MEITIKVKGTKIAKMISKSSNLLASNTILKFDSLSELILNDVKLTPKRNSSGIVISKQFLLISFGLRWTL